MSICPSRDGAQAHIFDNGRCVLCLKPASPLDLCDTCQGTSDPYCTTHGIGASNARQSEFYRRWNEKHGD